MTQNMIKEKSFEFSVSIIWLYKTLKEHWEYIISKQLLRSWTSIGANIEEAMAWQTKKDFLAKFSIASKESRETKYRLKLLQRTQLVKLDYQKYLKEIDEIINIITKIVKTTAKNIQHSKSKIQN